MKYLELAFEIGLALFLVFATLWFAATEAKAAPPKLMYSTNVDCSNPVPLDGAEFYGDVCLFFTPPIDQILTLHWNQNLIPVDSYPVFMGDDITVSMGEIRDVSDTPINYQKDKDGILLDPTIVGTTFNDKELGWLLGEQRCFRLKARVNYGDGRGSVESGFSKAVCTTNVSMTEVNYYINDPTLSGAPLYKAIAAPWAYVGPIPLGIQNMVAVANFTGGVEQIKLDVTFNVIKKPIEIPTGLEIGVQLVF